MNEVCRCRSLTAEVKDGKHVDCGKPMAEKYAVVCGDCHVEMMEVASDQCPVNHGGHWWMKVPASEAA